MEVYSTRHFMLCSILLMLTRTCGYAKLGGIMPANDREDYEYTNLYYSDDNDLPEMDCG